MMMWQTRFLFLVLSMSIFSEISVLSFPMIFQNAFPQPYNGRMFQDFSNFYPKRNMFQDLRQANFRKKRTQMPNNFEEDMLDAYLRDNESKRNVPDFSESELDDFLTNYAKRPDAHLGSWIRPIKKRLFF